PKLLLLDEPLSALDRQVRASMQLELKRLQHEVGLTFVVVTHDQEEAMSMADRIAVLNDGRLEQLASPQELYAEPASRFVAAFIGTANLLDGAATAEGVDVPGIGPVSGRHAMSPGSPATAVVRPEDVAVGTEVSGGLRGTVVDTYFLGGASTISVEVPGLPAPLLASVHGATRLSRGADVGVAFGRATAVPRDPSQPASHGTTVPTTAIPVTDAAAPEDGAGGGVAAPGASGPAEAPDPTRSQDVSA
uniref:ABC transporter ATP-binding protein n=1 Tax=Agromyces litoreus TaxID=3158561 RepID=UPI003395DD4F